MARQKAVKGFFDQFIDKIDAIVETASNNSLHYLQEKQRLAREEARIAQEAAAKEARDKAEKLRKDAEEKLNVAVDTSGAYSQEMQDVALQEAEVAEAHADVVEAQEVGETVVKTGTGYSTAGIEYNYSAQVIDISKIPQWILKKPKVTEAINKALSVEARTDKDTFSIEGAELVKTPKASIR